MLRVVLINPPYIYPQPSMGLSLIGAIIEREGYQVEIVDGNRSDIVPIVAHADVVGFTAMTPMIDWALELASRFKNMGLITVLGGAHATLLPEETLKAGQCIDVIVRGEGDETIIELLWALENNESLDNVFGISFMRNGEIINTPDRIENVDLDSLPFIPWQRYKPHPPHGRQLPFASMITSRGCPYHCAFCSKSVFGNKFRGQSPERVVEEIAYYKDKFGIKEIAFYDDVFTLDRWRAYYIAEEILRRGLKISWTCETRVNLVDKYLLNHMKKAGCYAIAYGIESASPEILKLLDKDITINQVKAAVRMTGEAGMQTIGYFMIGSPNETVDTIRDTIELAKGLKLDYAQFAIAMPFPGTKLSEYYEKDIPWKSFVYAGNQVVPVFESDNLSRDDIQYWASRAYKEFYVRPSYVFQRLCRVRSIGDVRVLANGMSMLAENVRNKEGYNVSVWVVGKL